MITLHASEMRQRSGNSSFFEILRQAGTLGFSGYCFSISKACAKKDKSAKNGFSSHALEIFSDAFQSVGIVGIGIFERFQWFNSEGRKTVWRLELSIYVNDFNRLRRLWRYWTKPAFECRQNADM
ncbi:hypothetical protein [Aestuariivirga sp.]|uniref:hypothetical protein n=1 Tax=Aestuariivirga sp. TaxID=2650926 RepID=UPI0035947A67